GEGTRVALLAANCLEYAACLHALARLGGMLVPLNTRLAMAELRWQVEDVRAEALLHDEQPAAQASEGVGLLPDMPRFSFGGLSESRFRPRRGGEGGRRGSKPPAHGAGRGRGSQLPAHVDQAKAAERRDSLDVRPSWRAPALQSRGHLSADRTPTLEGREAALRDEIELGATQAILYTSGTMGPPKGALITYSMQWWSAVGSALHLGLRPDDRWLACLPFYHIGGLSMLLKNVIYGAPVLILER